MESQIDVALIYKKDYNFFNENHFDKTTYYFFLKALPRNKDINIKFYPIENEFDCRKLKGKTDIILLANNRTDATPEKLIGIKESNIPVISRIGDPHSAERYNQIDFHEKWGIDYILFVFIFVTAIALFLKRTNISFIVSFVCIALASLVRYECI